MSEFPVPAGAPSGPPAKRESGVALSVPSAPVAARTAGAEELSGLFGFMKDAERRFQTLRMTILDRQIGARGESAERVNVWIRHPGMSKLIAGEQEGPARGGYQAWVGDGATLTHYDADAGVVRSRPRLAGPVGAATDPELPTFARVYEPLTSLPAGSVADTFVHPHGFCRNVLTTGTISMQGVETGATGREIQLLRCDHPRSTEVLTDRPDHWLLVGVDRTTGLILLLEEHVGDQLTRRAEVTALALDESMGDEIFELHVSEDVRRLY